MKRHLTYLILMLSAVTFSCHSNTNKQLIAQYTNRLTKPDTLPKQLNIQDRSLYSPAFIDSLQRANYPGSIKLENNYIVVGKDTTHFPEDLRKDTSYVFTGYKDSTRYTLKVKRLNLTDLNYSCTISKGQAILFKQQGTAILNPLFFLAAEAPEDDQTGDMFGAYAYTEHSSKDFTVLIGVGRDDHEKMRAVLNNNLLARDAPVLKTK